jgi:hypothetical protein
MHTEFQVTHTSEVFPTVVLLFLVIEIKSVGSKGGLPSSGNMFVLSFNENPPIGLKLSREQTYWSHFLIYTRMLEVSKNLFLVFAVNG